MCVRDEAEGALILQAFEEGATLEALSRALPPSARLSFSLSKTSQMQRMSRRSYLFAWQAQVFTIACALLPARSLAKS